MSSPLVVLPNSAPRRPAPRNTRVARGTETTNVKNRQLRLHQNGERPWEGRDDDHRGQINVEIEGDAYVVFKPSIGALSALDLKDYIAFTVYTESGGDLEALENYYSKAGLNTKEAKAFALGLTKRLERDGWTRTELPEDTAEKLSSVYFTITRWCDLGCPYCYQGLENRVGTEMSVEQAELVLDRIKAINPNCQIIVTGGEPFSHSQVFEILELVNQKGFPFVILSNGSYIDDKTARFLKGLEKFKYVQISLDGATAEVHELTRGKGHFEKAMTGFNNIVANNLAFKVAPTLHEANVHELPQIADLALSNGGWLSPNQLKELPHAGLNYTYVSLSNDTLRQALREVNEAMIGKYGFAKFAEMARTYDSDNPEVCSVASPNSKFICGMADSLVDIDWNGDVYPCHLSKGPDLLIGNIFEEDFASIFQRVEDRGIRVKSNEIEQCSGCKFVSNCAGGCRAGAWFTYGTLEHHDELCEVNYSSNLSRLLIGAGLK